MTYGRFLKYLGSCSNRDLEYGILACGKYKTCWKNCLAHKGTKNKAHDAAVKFKILNRTM